MGVVVSRYICRCLAVEQSSPPKQDVWCWDIRAVRVDPLLNSIPTLFTSYDSYRTHAKVLGCLSNRYDALTNIAFLKTKPGNLTVIDIRRTYVVQVLPPPILPKQSGLQLCSRRMGGSPLPSPPSGKWHG